jgi:hypothetical protein
VAGSLVQSLARALAGAGDGDNVLRFDSRAAHLARFLVDRAAGTGDRWYYRRFDGLRRLPCALAIATAVRADVPEGLAALQSLAVDERTQVLRALGPNGAARVLEAFAATSGRSTVRECIGDAADRWLEHRAQFSDVTLRALAIFVAVADEHRRGQELGAAIAFVARAAEAIERRKSESAASSNSAFDGDDTAIGAHHPRRSRVDSLDEELFASAVRCLERGIDTPAPSPVAERFSTALGGIFLLLPDLDVDALRVAQLRLDDDEAINLRCVSQLTLALCLDALSPTLWLEGPIRDLFGVPPALDMAAAWRGATDEQRDQIAQFVDATLKSFAQRLPGFAGSGPDHLRRNFLHVAASFERETGRLVVRLARPPLHVILALAGLLRRRFDVPWLVEVPIETFPEDAVTGG